MRVVVVSDFGSVNGGAAKVAIESARGLAEAGVEVVFACAVAPVSERLNHPGISVELFGAHEVWKVGSRLAAARQGVWNEAAHAWLSALLARQPPGAVVHLHQWTKAFSPAAIAAAGESGLAVVVTMHDYFSFCPAGGYFDFQKGRPCDKAPMGAACVTTNCDRATYAHKLVRVARQWRSDRALATCRDLTFIHVSGFARRFAEPFLPADARHATVENMITVPITRDAARRTDPHALFVGRLTEEKGTLLLARAARRAGVKLRFVGEGPMAEAISAANPDALVSGWLDETAVADAMAAAHVVVAPSLWFETGPLTVLEAAALGVPAIVSDRIGAADWVIDGESGRHVPQGDETALAAALVEVMEDGVAARWGARARSDFAAAPFTNERHVAKLLDAYRAVATLRTAA